jgi:transmembrane sensor
VQLADGSVVSAGPNTLVQVDYSDGTRRINLQRGEAMFKVKKDPTRPFIVNAGGALARAVGTRFGVDRHDDRVRVTVAEGKVAVVRAYQAAALEHDVDLRVALGLEKDEGVEIRLSTPMVPLHKEKVDSIQALAWANGQLILQRETVGEAVEEFNRRNRVQIRVDDAAIAGGHLCCIFDVGDPEAFAKLIAGMRDDIELVREGSNTLRIQRRSGQAVAPSRDDAI